jgi:adenylate cyclase
VGGSQAARNGIGAMSAAEGERLIDAVFRRIQLHGWIAIVIGAAIVFIAIGFLIPIFYDPAERDDLARENLPFAVAIVVVGGIAFTRLIGHQVNSALVWLRDGRQPDEREHHLTLSLASRLALMDACAWAIAAILMGVVNLHHSLGFAAVVTSAVWLGGETTSAVLYLLYERALRPITSLALMAREAERPGAAEAGGRLTSIGGFVAPGIRTRLLSTWSLGTGVPIIGTLTVGIVGLTKPGVDTEYVAAACVFLASVAVVVGLLVTLFAARAIADPVVSVREALDRVAAGDYETQVPIDDPSEVGLLQAGFNRMAEGLRERERIRDMFGRQVGREVARAALRDGTRLGGEERAIGALFVDLVGSTSMALAMPPSEVVRLLNRFFRVVIEVVEGEGGLVNKFEGDAALCVFGAPVASDNPAGDALRAARLLSERLEREVAEVDFGIGVSAGRAVAGNVGAEHRFEYTVIGDPVNEAARLCELSKERQEPVVASGSALERAGSESHGWRFTERTVLRGRIEATDLAAPRS